MEAMRQTLSFSIVSILGTQESKGALDNEKPVKTSRTNSSSSEVRENSKLPLSPPSSEPGLQEAFKMAVKDEVSDSEIDIDEERTQAKRPGRMRFTPAQIQALEKKFQKQHYLLPADRKFLAKSLDMTERQVKTWFQNKRAQYKRTRPLVRNPVYHHPTVSSPFLLPTPPQLQLQQPSRPNGCVGRVPGLLQFPLATYPTLPALCIPHTAITSPPPSCLPTLTPPHLPMPMAYIPVPITPPQ